MYSYISEVNVHVKSAKKNACMNFYENAEINFSADEQGVRDALAMVSLLQKTKNEFSIVVFNYGRAIAADSQYDSFERKLNEIEALLSYFSLSEEEKVIRDIYTKPLCYA